LFLGFKGFKGILELVTDLERTALGQGNDSDNISWSPATTSSTLPESYIEDVEEIGTLTETNQIITYQVKR
jgi:hypothetical protein